MGGQGQLLQLSVELSGVAAHGVGRVPGWDAGRTTRICSPGGCSKWPELLLDV